MRPALVFPPEFDIPPTSADRSILLIGRHPQCDVVLRAAAVSRRHCVLVESDDDLLIRDLGSRHGVWVNGKRVEETLLFPGDEIAIGPVIVRVVDPDELETGGESSQSGFSTEAGDAPTVIHQGLAIDSDLTDGSEEDNSITEPLTPGNSAEPTLPPVSEVGSVPGAARGEAGDDDIPSDSNLGILL